MNTMRVALYARYSSDLQRQASIADQVRECRAYAASRGWVVTHEFSDAALSGSTMRRPGLQALLRVVMEGGCDLVLAEGMDRLSRDLADISAITKRFRFAGVRLHTLIEHEVGTMHVGLKGTMNEMYLAELAVRTHRGVKGRVLAGQSGGGNSYGYALVPGQVGARVIDDSQAAIVRRIFAEYAAGDSSKTIARRLNADGVPGPRTTWSPSTIHGQPGRGTGILNNELYIGRLVWDRLDYVTHPETGKRLSRQKPREGWTVVDVPHLRIVSEAMWEAVKARQASMRLVTAGRPERARRPRHLFSGLTVCGVCGGGFTMGSKDGLICYNARERGTCTNRRRLPRQELEARVLTAMKQRLFAPDRLREMCALFTAEVERGRRERLANQAGAKRELATVERRQREIVRAIADGFRHPAMKDEMDVLEARRLELLVVLADQPAPALHPNMGEVFRQKAETLAAGLESGEGYAAAREALRGFISRIVIPPEGLLQVVGNLGAMLGIPQDELRCGNGGCGGSQLPQPHREITVAA